MGLVPAFILPASVHHCPQVGKQATSALPPWAVLAMYFSVDVDVEIDTGSIPADLGKMTEMAKLDLSCNLLSGERGGRYLDRCFWSSFVLFLF